MRRMYSKPQLLEAVEQESKINGIKVFEDVVDKDGHKRFIEGTITQETITGITPGYSKWSLSGSHLMFVVCGTIADSTSVTSGSILMQVKLPDWIMNKIYPVYSNNIEYKITGIFAENGTSQNIGNYLQKADGYIRLRLSAVTTTAERFFRFAYDLLIDNE